MFQKNLQDSIDHLKSRVKLLGVDPPTRLPSTCHKRVQPDRGRLPSSSEALYVSVPRPAAESDSLVEAAHDLPHGNDSSSESHDDENDADGSDSEYTDSGCRTPSNRAASNAVSSTAPETKYQRNLRVYGTICPKTNLDVFVRCVIALWAIAPKPTDSSLDIRERAKSQWRKKVAVEQKLEWQQLFEDRHNMATDIAVAGSRLLRSQGLLAKVVPENRLQAIKRHLEHAENRCGDAAETSRIHDVSESALSTCAGRNQRLERSVTVPPKSQKVRSKFRVCQSDGPLRMH